MVPPKKTTPRASLTALKVVNSTPVNNILIEATEPCQSPIQGPYNTSKNTSKNITIAGGNESLKFITNRNLRSKSLKVSNLESSSLASADTPVTRSRNVSESEGSHNQSSLRRSERKVKAPKMWGFDVVKSPVATGKSVTQSKGKENVNNNNNLQKTSVSKKNISKSKKNDTGALPNGKNINVGKFLKANNKDINTFSAEVSNFDTAIKTILNEDTANVLSKDVVKKTPNNMIITKTNAEKSTRSTQNGLSTDKKNIIDTSHEIRELRNRSKLNDNSKTSNSGVGKSTKKCLPDQINAPRSLPDRLSSDATSRTSSGSTGSRDDYSVSSSKPSFIKRKLYSQLCDFTEEIVATENTSFLEKKDKLNFYSAKNNKRKDSMMTLNVPEVKGRPSKISHAGSASADLRMYCLRKTNDNKKYTKYFAGADDNSVDVEPTTSQNTFKSIAGILGKINVENTSSGSSLKSQEETKKSDDDVDFDLFDSEASEQDLTVKENGGISCHKKLEKVKPKKSNNIKKDQVKMVQKTKKKTVKKVANKKKDAQEKPLKNSASLKDPTEIIRNVAKPINEAKLSDVFNCKSDNKTLSKIMTSPQTSTSLCGHNRNAKLAAQMKIKSCVSMEKLNLTLKSVAKEGASYWLRTSDTSLETNNSAMELINSSIEQLNHSKRKVKRATLVTSKSTYITVDHPVKNKNNRSDKVSARYAEKDSSLAYKKPQSRYNNFGGSAIHEEEDDGFCKFINGKLVPSGQFSDKISPYGNTRAKVFGSNKIIDNKNGKKYNVKLNFESNFPKTFSNADFNGFHRGYQTNGQSQYSPFENPRNVFNSSRNVTSLAKDFRRDLQPLGIFKQCPESRMWNDSRSFRNIAGNRDYSGSIASTSYRPGTCMRTFNDVSMIRRTNNLSIASGFHNQSQFYNNQTYNGLSNTIFNRINYDKTVQMNKCLIASTKVTHKIEPKRINHEEQEDVFKIPSTWPRKRRPEEEDVDTESICSKRAKWDDSVSNYSTYSSASNLQAKNQNINGSRSISQIRDDDSKKTTVCMFQKRSVLSQSQISTKGPKFDFTAANGNYNHPRRDVLKNGCHDATAPSIVFGCDRSSTKLITENGQSYYNDTFRSKVTPFESSRLSEDKWYNSTLQQSRKPLETSNAQKSTLMQSKNSFLVKKFTPFTPAPRILDKNLPLLPSSVAEEDLPQNLFRIIEKPVQAESQSLNKKTIDRNITNSSPWRFKPFSQH